MRPELKNFKTFKVEADFATVNSGAGLDSYDNYSGPDLAGWLCGPTRSRDSDFGEESNFEVALERLGGESEDVQVHRFGHWGCGWFERILVSKKSAKARELYQIYLDLEEYPFLDEDDYTNRESEYQSDFAEGARKELAKALAKHFKVKVSTRLTAIAYDLNMVCQQHYGNDSCIDIYSGREPDAVDIKRLAYCLEQLEWEYKTSALFKKLTVAVNDRLVKKGKVANG